MGPRGTGETPHLVSTQYHGVCAKSIFKMWNMQCGILTNLKMSNRNADSSKKLEFAKIRNSIALDSTDLVGITFVL